MELTAAATALRAGVSEQDLARVGEDRVAGRSLVVQLTVLTDLVSRGVPPDTAAAAVLAVAREGGSDDELLALRREVEQDVRAGIAPATSAIIRSRLKP